MNIIHYQIHGKLKLIIVLSTTTGTILNCDHDRLSIVFLIIELDLTGIWPNEFVVPIDPRWAYMC